MVVPSLLKLQDDGYGVEQGIPSLVLAASSLDDVLSISMFGVFLGLCFSNGERAWVAAVVWGVRGRVWGADWRVVHPPQLGWRTTSFAVRSSSEPVWRWASLEV